MYIKTKRGSLDNIVTYEHYCDTIDDLQQIPLQYTTLGSVAIVLQGQNDGFEVYMANSNHEWVSLGTGGGGGSGGGGTAVFDAHFVDDVDATINEQVFHAVFFVDADPAEIIAAYKAGKHVVIHFIADEASREYSTFYDGYYSLLGYDEGNIATNGGFRFDNDAIYSYGVGLSGYGIDEVTGKLAFPIYID